MSSAAIIMEIPETWPAPDGQRNAAQSMLDAFEREFGRVLNAMHDLHPDVRMHFDVSESQEDGTTLTSRRTYT